MTRWLAVAEWLCGTQARRTVFEPLVADWQRQWSSSPHSTAGRIRIAASGASALLIAAEQTRPRWNVHTLMTGGLTIALGTLGWALGALGRTRPVHALACWTLACLALLVLDGEFGFWIRPLGMRGGRVASWEPLALFGMAAILILLAAQRTRHETLGTNP